MALDGLLLSSLVSRMQELKGAKIGKIQNISEEEIILLLHPKYQKTIRLILNVHSNTNRLYVSQESLSALPSPSNFVMLLRKKISQGYINEIEQIGFDRLVKFSIIGHNELGDVIRYDLYAELMGKYSNLVLVDHESNTIIDCLKRIPVFENSKRLLHPGAQYTLPTQIEKLNPLTLDPTKIDTSKSLVSQVEGFSPLLSKEFLYRLSKGETFASIIQEVLHSDQLYIYGKEYHSIVLEHLDQPFEKAPLMEGLAKLYKQDETKTRLIQQCGDVFKAVDREVKKLEKKLPKLEKTLADSNDYPKYQEYGDLLFCYLDEIEKEPLIEVPSLSEDVWVKIPIDMRYDLKTNANLNYKKYHKLKRSQSVLRQQIEQTQIDLDYYKQIQNQLKFCTLQDALEIREELVKNKLLIPQKNSARKKRSTTPNVLHLILEDGEIFVGKNNIQNTFITHKLARKNDLWFHVKDYHGSHVLLISEKPSEIQIRMAANLAAWFSRGKESSSVPVDYTKVSNLKKIPGSKAGLVSMSTYKTIYIDPEESQIQQWIDQYKV